MPDNYDGASIVKSVRDGMDLRLYLITKEGLPVVLDVEIWDWETRERKPNLEEESFYNISRYG